MYKWNVDYVARMCGVWLGKFQFIWNKPSSTSGDILACLVNSLAPGLVPDFAEMDPANARDNIDRAMAMALEWMDIPRVLEPEDMMDPNVSGG